MSFESEMWGEMSVLQAAHACELLLKARIAQEHPLLIFEQMPRLDGSAPLALRDLAERGRTIAYAELPDRLFVTTGEQVPNVDQYLAFGRRRNSIQHFAPPSGVDCTRKTVEFVYGVIDPFINQMWGLFAVDHHEDYEPYENLVAGLMMKEVEFLVSPGAAADFSADPDTWTNVSDKYFKTMQTRHEHAKSLL